MRDFFAIFEVIVWPDHALDGVLEDEIRQLIARKEGASQCSAICGDDQNFSCECMILFRKRPQIDREERKVLST